MRKPPGLVVVVDPSKEHLAVAEANKLGIPVMGLVDTNCNPDPIEYIIACNDDALKSIKLILETLVKAIVDKKNDIKVYATKEEQIEGEEEGEVSRASSEESLEEIEAQEGK